MKLKKKLNKKKYFYLEKKISEENYEKIMKLGDKSIKPEEKVLRMYPQKNLFSHIIGQIDDDNNGISGLEKSFNEILRKSKKDIKLTVDNISSLNWLPNTCAYKLISERKDLPNWHHLISGSYSTIHESGNSIISSDVTSESEVKQNDYEDYITSKIESK